MPADPGQRPKINLPTVRPELVEGLPVLRQAQHERHNDPGKLFFGCCLAWLKEARDEMDFLLAHHLSVDVIAPHFPHDPEGFIAYIDKTVATIHVLIPAYEWQKPPGSPVR